MTLKIGDRIRVSINGYEGTISFIGKTSFANGLWIGIQLDEPVGKSDGSIRGQSYFKCEENHGMFLRENKIELIESIDLDILPEVDLLTKERLTIQSQVSRISRILTEYEEYEYDDTNIKHEKIRIKELKKLIIKNEKEIESFKETEISNLNKISLLKEQLSKVEIPSYLLKLINEYELVHSEVNLIKEKLKEIERERSLMQRKFNTDRFEIQSEIKELKERISQYDIEFEKQRKRKELFGEELSRESLIKYRDKISKIKRKVINAKKRNLDIELGKSQFGMKMESILEQQLIDRTNWIDRFITTNPGINDLRSRISPLIRAIKFASTYSTGSLPDINNLIMHWFEIEGKREIREFIEKAEGIEYESTSETLNRLDRLLLSAINQAEGLYDICLDSSIKSEEKIEIAGTRIETLGLDVGLMDDDIHIWDEPEDNPENIRILNNAFSMLDKIQAGNINKLVINLTSKQTDPTYISAFLMTYRSFTKPEYLLLKLQQRYDCPPTIRNQIERDVIQLKVISVLNKWINTSFFDFRENPKLLIHLKGFLVEITQDRAVVGERLLRLVGDMEARKEYEGIVTFRELPPPVKVPSNIFSPSLSLYDIEEEEFCRQLCLYCSSLYRKIRPTELVTQAWSKPKLHHKAKNVLEMINQFNEFAEYVSTEIVKPESVRERAKVLDKFISIGENLYKKRNFHSLMGIIAGITSSSVNRLNFTKEVSKLFHKLESFKELMSSTNNSSNYRTALRETDSACVPHLGVFLTDIVMIADGSPDKIDGLINFSKRKLLSNVVIEIQTHQMLQYNFTLVNQIQNLFLNCPKGLIEKENYNISLKREPRKCQRTDLIW